MEKAVTIIKKANKCVIFTGAGMSKDSGIDTFRGAGGFWNGLFGKIILLYAGVPFGWHLTPGLVWSYFISNFYTPIINAKPHDGYYALNDLRLHLFKFKNKFHVITMNVDGLHQESGIPDNLVYEIHGSVKKFCCITCKKSMNIINPIETKNNSPRCQCGGYARPDVTLFTESLPNEPWEKANSIIKQLNKNDVMIIIGTSSVVYPAASIPSYAKARGVTIIEINPELYSPLGSNVDIYLQGTALNILPDLIKQIIGNNLIPIINEDDENDDNNEKN